MPRRPGSPHLRDQVENPCPHLRGRTNQSLSGEGVPALHSVLATRLVSRHWSEFVTSKACPLCRLEAGAPKCLQKAFRTCSPWQTVPEREGTLPNSSGTARGPDSEQLARLSRNKSRKRFQGAWRRQRRNLLECSEANHFPPAAIPNSTARSRMPARCLTAPEPDGSLLNLEEVDGSLLNSSRAGRLVS